MNKKLRYSSISSAYLECISPVFNPLDHIKPGVMTYIYDLCIWEMAVGESGVKDQLGLHGTFEASLWCTGCQLQK